MARIRTIKPDAFTSDSLSSVPRGTRWTFAGLWTYADDAGRGRDDARLIKAALYPLDDTVSLTDVATDMDLLANIGGICRYEVDGKRFFHMPKWEHQKINRPTPAKSPPCPIHESDVTPQRPNSEGSLNPHGAVSEPSGGEKEGKGKGVGKGRGESERSAPDATPPTALVLVQNDRPDVDRLCDLLADEIEANGANRPTIGKKWHDAARLMLDRDGRTEAQVAAAIRWCQSDEFWRTNILSMPKLREQYERLRLAAERSRAPTTRRNDIDWEAAAARAAAKDAANGETR